MNAAGAPAGSKKAGAKFEVGFVSDFGFRGSDL
jgi:hypothetical protein